MVRLRQTVRPAPQANWTEHFYSGALKVVGGETETDNQNWIDQLLGRGFTIVDGDQEQVETLGEVSFDKPVEPQGTQVVEADTEIKTEKEPEVVAVDESRYNEETEAVNVVEEPTVEELTEEEHPSMLEDLMTNVLHPKPRKSRRKK